MIKKGMVETMAYNKNIEINAKTNEEMEHALYHLMYQFRQINSKYGLMVGKEIKELYDEKTDLICSSKGYIRMIEREMEVNSS